MPHPSLSIEIPTPQHQALVPVTRQIQRAVEQLGLVDGVVHLIVQHTTCGLMINENADPDVCLDILRRLETLIPWHDSEDRHAEGNTAAHLRSILTGCTLTIPVEHTRLQLGTWQGIFLAEFDGPRTRRILATSISRAEEK
ncbi:MAG: YjbQ family protein [Proteobacteria bacterium]|nr:MAG: YjbQ family protein [Pseudomonadota bacterium]